MHFLPFTIAIWKRNPYNGICGNTHFYVSTLLDVNECANISLTTCHRNADCSNIPGTYQCSCKIGYTGNGTHCVGM